MRKSKFTIEDRKRIIEETQNNSLTIEKICSKYGISTNTFYLWKRTLKNEQNIDKIINEVVGGTKNQIIVENKTLRSLYINLSAHNYELAKFLKQ